MQNLSNCVCLCVAFTIGKGLVAGASVFGLGSLCFYGMGLSREVGAYERSLLWPEYVKTRIRDTYAYFGMSILAVAGSAAAAVRNPTIMRFAASNSIGVTLGTMAALVALSAVTHSIPYTEGFGAKQCAWLAHCGLVGTILAPLSYLGGPILLKAGLYTAGICGGLSLLAVCAPSEKYLSMGGPLAIGLGVVFASCMGEFPFLVVGSIFLPAHLAHTSLGAGLHSIILYGGLVLFSGYLLYDTQRTIADAEKQRHYDPIDHSISIYMSVINIFIRMVMILADGNSKKRR
ncbi:GHITM [Cordylochernes scorpioides]|uniref:GHITM n=1 Tax=Cordylochernes scorpioides TaxID=51811 RepID=A0ABY6LDM4_9ARAC|nr:GHITM [Cordylochernes scorpioides]